jgi:hypothetical protein
VADVLRTARKIGAPCVEIGTVGGTALAIEGVASVPLEIMRTAYEGTLPRIAGES